MNRLLLLVGPVWLAVTYALAAAGAEPVATHFYLCAWAGLIFTLDRLIAGRSGASMLRGVGPTGMLQLFFWSAVCWLFYELCNFRLQNWYYVLVEDQPGLRLLATFLAFGTVFPGIFWIDTWLQRAGFSKPVHIRPLQLTTARRVGMIGGGVLFFILWMTDPTHFYPLVWGGTFLLLAPLNERLGIDGLLRQWQRGDLGPTLRLLLAGFIAGGCWEFFNFWARAKWIYTVPFFDELKLFEMPLLGFLGFPPFAVECACTYRLLVWARLCPPFGAFLQQGPARSTAVLAGVSLIALVGSLAVYEGMQRWTVTSTTPRVVDVAPLTLDQRQVLAALEVEHLTELVRHGSARRWQQVTTRLDSASTSRLQDLVELYMHQGIGTGFGDRLVAAGITSRQQLGRLTAALVLERLMSVKSDAPLPRIEQVRVWLQRLPLD
ncbi:MAG: hypothetical protein HN712_24510 [Gemmatimonadetes bacterium]|nr:hypothetical protein [Gemmatimonadota bacterium]MBT7863501.1 hypothetical protein [Gemmatimonadota bacterium]